MNLKERISIVKDFPKKGVDFLDITSILEKPEVYDFTVKQLLSSAHNKGIKTLIGVDARGFIWAGALAYLMQCPLHLVRKAGKLPGEVVEQAYQTEYSEGTLAIHKNIDITGPVMIIDDILATGGTLLAVGTILETHFNIPAAQQLYATLIDLSFLHGKKNLEEKGYEVFSLVTY